MNFNSYQVTGHTTFYGKYVPKDTIEEDKSFITVEKHITGIDESQIDENFYVQVGNRFLKKNTATVEKKDGTIILRWTIPDVGEGTYDIGEANQWVEGYIVKQGGDFGSSVEVKAKTFTVDPVGKIINSCSNHDLKVGVEGDYNFIFVVSENSKNRKNVVISKEPLSLSQRNAVVNALGKVGSTFSGQDTVFYSIKDNNEVVIDRTHLTYSSNGEVHIGDTSQWNKALQLKYNVTEGNNPEVKVTNDYTPNSSDLTVTKTVTGLLGDHEKQFSFTLSFNQPIDPEKLAKITWTKSDGTNGTLTDQTYTFTLAHGQNIVFQGIPAGVTATVTEESYKNYTTKYKIHDTDKLALFDWNSPTDGKAANVTINATAQTIQFLNQNEAEPDMGVLLDTLPYILILVVVAGGGVLLFLRKRKNDDDE